MSRLSGCDCISGSRAVLGGHASTFTVADLGLRSPFISFCYLDFSITAVAISRSVTITEDEAVADGIKRHSTFRGSVSNSNRDSATHFN